jgi:hypothetical protein
LLQNVFEVDLDIKQKTAIKMPTVTQNDTVVFVCRIFDDGRIYNIQSGTTFTMTATRPDKVTVITEGSVTDENIVEFTLGTTELAVAGKVNTVVQVYDAEGRISTIPFGYYVLNDPSTDYIPSEHEETLIERVLGDGPQVIDDATQAGDYAQSVADENKTTWLTPVATYEDIVTTYVEPNHGDTVQVLDTGKIYRYTSGNWAFTQAYSSTQLNAIQNQLSEQDQQTQTLQNGLNVLSSDQASPLKVEFDGNTLVNHIPNFNSGLWSLHPNATIIDDKTLELNADANYQQSTIEVSALKNQTYFFKCVGTTSVQILDETDTNIGTVKFTGDGNYKKFTTVANANKLKIILTNNSTGTFTFEEPRLYAISQETYDKIGVSLTDADVERMFPYVDSVQHVRNPYVKVSGANLLPPFTEWNLHDNATVVSPYELRLDATGSYQASHVIIDCLPNQKYTFKADVQEGNIYIAYFDENGNRTAMGTNFTTITTPSNAVRLEYRWDNSNVISKRTLKNPMLTLGSEPRPFVPKNDSYLYAYKVNEETGENEPLILAGNDDKKDISYYNEDKRRWEKRGHFKVDDMLDGSRDWTYNRDNAGFKNFIIRTFDMNTTSGHTPIVSKFDGSLVDRVYSSTTPNTTYFSDGHLYLTIYDAETGFTEEMTPSSDLIKSYFYGYFYRGDGTTHSWRPIGDTDDTRLTTTLPTSPSPTMLDGTIQPYKLTYQLSKPTVEEVRVEGDLSIQGSAQVEVSSGFDVTTNEDGEKEFTMWTDRSKTANLTEVIAKYNSSLKSSFQSVVSKQSDIATDQTILKRQMLDVLVRLDALEGTQ